MPRILIKVAYDGTEYHGFQIQDNGRTIQGELQRALFELTGESITLIGGSRTDAGVHSKGNVAVFDTVSRISPLKFAKALNTKLPHDIVVWYSDEAAPNFHPRKVKSIKTYEYSILNADYEDPLLMRFFHHIPRILDIEGMKKAAVYFEGEHDFTSFCTASDTNTDKVRTIYSSKIITDKNDERILRYHVEGNGFLYNMVRIMTGTLIQVGLGQFSPSDIPGMIEKRHRGAAGSTAPAKGLCHMGTIWEV